MSDSKIEELKIAFIGKDINDSISMIEEVLSMYKVHTVRTDMFVTADFRLNRVRVYYDLDNKIVDISIG